MKSLNVVIYKQSRNKLEVVAHANKTKCMGQKDDDGWFRAHDSRRYVASVG